MRTLPTLIALLATMLSVAACSASEPQQSGQAAPSREAQATPAPKESTPQESASRESAQDGEGNEAIGLSVTTINDEQVNLGGQGDVTALYFMAGW